MAPILRIMFSTTMRKIWLSVFLVFLSWALVGCAEKKQAAVAPPPAPAPKPAPVEALRPIRSEMPATTAEVIQHCVITKRENSNTVSCACIPVTTRIDSKTGHTEIVCKKMKEER